MDLIIADDRRLEAVASLTYRQKPRPVRDVGISWLSREGEDAAGQPAYGLRLFQVGPGGEIPIHNHLYLQTMYILSGEFECWEFDPDTDELKETVTCRAGDTVFVPSLAPHGMRNLSSEEPATFLCCICTLAEDQGA
jgi:quercetin dioxygenase-like cupin family protein